MSTIIIYNKRKGVDLYMEEKKVIKIKFRTIIILIIILLVIISAVCMWLLLNKKANDEPIVLGGSFTYTSYSYIPLDDFNKLNAYSNYATGCVNKLYNSSNIRNDDSNIRNIGSSGLSDGIIINNSGDLQKYINICNINLYYDMQSSLKKLNIDNSYWNTGSLILYMYYNDTSVAGIKVTNVRSSDNTVNINVAVAEGEERDSAENTASYITANAEILYVLTDKINDNSKLNFNITKYDVKLTSQEKIEYFDKPIIYLYPEQETEINVTLGNPQNLIHTYPKYEGSWNVIAKPDGSLTDVKTGRNLYSLYWEGISTVHSAMTDGFVVKGIDTISFLEDKLATLGLTQREADEFIIYWLPRLECNTYNLIRFETSEEINTNMTLEITPTPDIAIRVMMEYKPLDNPISIPEQQLTTPTRTGFVAVEWGGTEIK